MKLLSVTIPCYNSQEYMEHAIESALVGGDDIEILIVDDGSKDNTLEIAQKYEKQYPNIVRAIHKENGGHGSAVNTGIANAKGLYFKVLDSDDWFDKESLLKVINFLRDIVTNSISLDMLICNYVYEKPSAHKRKVINYFGAIPKDKFISWNDVKHFRMSQNLLMHSIIYKTKLLRDCNLKLPEHTFYVDNIYAYTPLPYVKKMYYLNVDLYRYFIGRDDQSVNEAVMTKRIDQQIKVTKLMIDSCNLNSIKNRKLRNYMTKYLAMMMIVSSALLVNEGSPESLSKRKELWHYLKNKSKKTYNIITHTKLGLPLQMKSKSGRKVIVWCYHLFNRIYGFN
ncbi:MAG: glycosyltransferase [Lachnospiraceae bacterium]|nr:glycosyltransferase [Lachnospiraceae bacterium]MCI5586342.1 glycosyltransferase [Lachnospiraceae bacterium]